MNETVCFKNSLPTLFDLHERWGHGHGKEADKLKKTFKGFGVSTANGDWQWNNIRRTKEWLATGKTVGRVYYENATRFKEVKHPDSLPIGMDLIERRTRNRSKLQVQAEKILAEQPWQHDHHMTPDHTLHQLTNYLSSRPFYGKATEANDLSQSTPAWIIFDKAGNVLWRMVGNVLDVHLRDVLLPYLMNVKSAKPLCSEKTRQETLEEYRTATKYAPGAHVGKVVVHHDGDLSSLYPPIKEEPKDEAKDGEKPEEEKKEEKKEEEKKEEKKEEEKK